MKKLVLYVHGKGGSPQEAEHYCPLFPDRDVLGLDYTGATPWETKTEFQQKFDTLTSGYSSVILIANSIGAYFSMNALQDRKIQKAYFISPIVNMEKLIGDMMHWANVSEEELEEAGELQTAFGETLSWNYLEYVRKNPISWEIPTAILYAEDDILVPRETVESFAKEHHASLCQMPKGEHWFHTEEQMHFLDQWILSEP